MVYLKLFVKGDGTRGRVAEANLRDLCDRLLGSEYDLDVVDVLTRPGEAEDRRIVATPTVVRFDCDSDKRILGDLTNRERVARALGLPEHAESSRSKEVGGATQR